MRWCSGDSSTVGRVVCHFGKGAFLWSGSVSHFTSEEGRETGLDVCRLEVFVDISTLTLCQPSVVLTRTAGRKARRNFGIMLKNADQCP